METSASASRKDQDGGKRERRGKRKDEEKPTTKDSHTNRSRQPCLRHCGVEELRRTGLQRLLPVANKEYEEEVPWDAGPARRQVSGAKRAIRRNGDGRRKGGAGRERGSEEQKTSALRR
ncbi:hypothetical protein K438DRAFT_1771722 [Mycena galopus ATCC 62051]|nr:hypothetical protein K438DRAFT_1771722 [Mycena galopus ATCC 62051]